MFGDGTFGGTLTTAGFGADRSKIAGQHAEEAAGVEVEIADVTGDGVGDLLIGRQNHTPEMGRPGAGALTILVGGPALRDHAEARDLPRPRRDSGGADRRPPSSAPPPTTASASGCARATSMETASTTSRWAPTRWTPPSTSPRTAVRSSSSAAGLTSPPIRPSISPTSGRWTFRARSPAHVAKLKPPTGSNDYHFGATCQIGDLDGDGKGEVIARGGAQPLERRAGLDRRATGNRRGRRRRAEGQCLHRLGRPVPFDGLGCPATPSTSARRLFVTRIRWLGVEPRQRRARRGAARRSRLRRRRRQRPLPRRSRRRRRQRFAVGNRARDLQRRGAGRAWT